MQPAISIVPRFGQKNKHTVLIEILERKKLEELGMEGAIILKYIFKGKFYGQHELIFFIPITGFGRLMK
jgi:hypothetical protein